MADDFEFDDFDDDDERSPSISVKEEKKSERISPGHSDHKASKKRRLNFDNGCERDAVHEGRIASGSKAELPSQTSSSATSDNSSVCSGNYEGDKTTRKPVFSQASESNPSLTTYDESPENCPSRYHARDLSDDSETKSTVSPSKRVHFMEGSREDVSHPSSREQAFGGVQSPQSAADRGASDVSVSQSTGDPVDSISTKSNYSYGANTQSQASSLPQSPCSSGKPGTPPRHAKRSPIKSGQGERSKVSNLREKSWITELDDDHETESQKTRKKRVSLRPLFETDEKLLIGAIGRSTQSLRDAGSSQLLHDEFVFMCNTLGENLSSIGPDREQLEIASRLVDLLSSQDTRRALFLEGQIIRKDEDSPLEAILNLLGSLDEINFLELTHRSPERKTNCLSLFLISTCPSETEGGVDHKTAEKTTASRHNSSKFQQLLDTMGMIVYLLAFDCTVCDAGISESSARNARDIRYQIMAHPRALRGILSLIRVDPLVSLLRARPADACGNTQDASVGSSPGSVAASSASSSHSLVVDPTKRGRFRKRRRQLFDDELFSVPEQPVADAPSESNKNTRKFKPASRGTIDELDFDGFTSKKRITPAQQKLDKVSCRVIDSLPSPSSTPDTAPMHTCSLRPQPDHRIVGDVSHSIPLVALGRIVRGKLEWCEKSCLDIELPDENGREFGTSSSHREPDPDDEGTEDDDNPLLQTNNLLGRSGCLPLLSKALCETLAAILWVLENRSPCRKCISYLYDKFSSLTSLVDDACLMNDGNREQLCREGYVYEFECSLVAGLASFLRVLEDKHLIFDGRVSLKNRIWDEMVLEILRSLTSLTHDNAYAARDFLKTKLRSRFDRGNNNELTSVEVISRVLYAATVRDADTGGHSSHSNKIRYDSVIFCLNILTNCVESSEGPFAFSLLSLSVPNEMNGNGSMDSTNFISWLAKWLVGETKSFRDAICAFGSESMHSQRRLETSENDLLVTAGNGFVLLASILAFSADDLVPKSSAGSITLDQNNVYDLILVNLPGNDYTSKVGFMKNLLTIFCNFYQVSIGDLSVAVTGPIKGLIRKLDTLSLPV